MKKNYFTQPVTYIHGRTLEDQFNSPPDVDSGRNLAELTRNVEPLQEAKVSLISCKENVRISSLTLF